MGLAWVNQGYACYVRTESLIQVITYVILE